MIESNIIEWIDFNDSIQIVDIYSKKNLLILFAVLRSLLKNKYLPLSINIFLIIIYFLQICSISISFTYYEEEIVFVIFNYIKYVLIFSEVITKSNFLKIFIPLFLVIIIEFIIIIIVLVLNKRKNLRIIYYLLNFINAIIFYYLIGPIILISLSTIYCEKNFHRYLNLSCFSNSTHILFIILSLIMVLLYIIIMIIYSICFIQINLIRKISLNDNTIRVNSNYDLYCLNSKIFFFIFYFISSFKKTNNVFKYIYISCIFIICLIMSFYTYKNVYYYNA